MIGCEDRLRNDLLCVGWGVKLYSLTYVRGRRGALSGALSEDICPRAYVRSPVCLVTADDDDDVNDAVAEADDDVFDCQ